MITGTITFYNLSSLHDTDNDDNTMYYEATIYIEQKPFRTMRFNRLESAHKFIHMYMMEEGKKHGT